MGIMRRIMKIKEVRKISKFGNRDYVVELQCGHEKMVTLPFRVNPIGKRKLCHHCKKVEVGFLCQNCGNKRRLKKREIKDMDHLKSEERCKKCGTMMVPYSTGGID